jgi:hypothetical protein
LRKSLIILPLAVFAALSTIGCGKDQYGDSLNPDRGFTVTGAGSEGGNALITGTSVISDEHGALPGGTDTEAAVKSTSEKSYQAGNMDDEEDNRQKAWMYWVLIGIRESYQAGTVPPDLAKALKEIEEKNRIVVPDESQKLVTQIVKILRQALEADKVASKLRSKGMDVKSMPWGSGRTGFADYKELDKSSELPDYGDVLGSSDPEGAMEQAIRYEEHHHLSPIQVRDDLFREAGMKMNELGANLNLLGKTPEDVHNAGRQHHDEVIVPNFGLETKIEPYRQTTGGLGLIR